MVPGDQPGVGPALTAARKRPSPFVGGGLLQWWPTVGYCTLHTSTMFVGSQPLVQSVHFMVGSGLQQTTICSWAESHCCNEH